MLGATGRAETQPEVHPLKNGDVRVDVNDCSVQHDRTGRSRQESV